MSNPQRFGIRIFADGGAEIPLTTFIPVFHRWIQTGSIEGLWIDVADYSHVPRGPGILLIGHEATLAIDESSGRRGLSCWRKQPLEGSLAERLETVLGTIRRAVRLLEEDRELDGLRFRNDEIEVVVNDRLYAPNREEAFGTLRPALETFLARVFGEQEIRLERESDPREPFTVRARVTERPARSLPESDAA